MLNCQIKVAGWSLGSSWSRPYCNVAPAIFSKFELSFSSSPLSFSLILSFSTLIVTIVIITISNFVVIMVTILIFSKMSINLFWHSLILVTPPQLSFLSFLQTNDFHNLFPCPALIINLRHTLLPKFCISFYHNYDKHLRNHSICIIFW